MQPKPAGSCAVAYEIAGDHILAKLFEDELTLVNLESGEYFAAGGIAVELWAELSEPKAEATLVAAILARYAALPQIVCTEVRKLLDDLVASGLIRETNAPVSPSPPPPLSDRKPWPGFWLEVYGDMKDLLLLDPVHDVGQGGWPPLPELRD